MKKKIVSTKTAPAAVGPYSQAVVIGKMVYVSGTLPLDPFSGGGLVPGGVDAQTRQILKNINEVLKEAGSSMDKVVKVNIFMKDLNDFAEMNEVYAEFFPEDQPARATVEVSRLPMDVAVEIECVAHL